MELDAVREGVLRTAMPLDLRCRGSTRATSRRGGGGADEGPRRPVRAERLTDDELRAGLRAAGLGDAQVEAIVGMSAGLRDGYVPEQPRTAVTTTPSTLEGWATAHLAPLL